MASNVTIDEQLKIIKQKLLIMGQLMNSLVAIFKTINKENDLNKDKVIQLITTILIIQLSTRLPNETQLNKTYISQQEQLSLKLDQLTLKLDQLTLKLDQLSLKLDQNNQSE